MGDEHLVNRVFTDDFTHIGPAFRGLVHARTETLAALAGRGPGDVTMDDYAQAKRELTGQSDPALQDAILEAPPGEVRPDPGPSNAAKRPLFSESSLRHRVETFQITDVGAVEIERNRLPYRRMFS